MQKAELTKALDLNTWEQFVGWSDERSFVCAECDARISEEALVVPTLMKCEMCDKVNLCITTRNNKRPLFVTFLAEHIYTPEKKSPSKGHKKHKGGSSGDSGILPTGEVMQ